MDAMQQSACIHCDTDDLTVRGKYTRSHGSAAYPVAYQRNALAAMAARESNYKRGPAKGRSTYERP